MKVLKTVIVMFSLLFSAFAANAQKVEAEADDFTILKGQKSINIEFNYDKVAVGDYAKESEYVKNKTNDMNAKEAGTGDAWAARWNMARIDRYHPKFDEVFTKWAEMTLDTAAKYTLIVKITFIEPGYQIAIQKKASQIEGMIYLVETAKKTKKLATATIERSGGMFRGGAFDFETRIAETYAVAARDLGKIVKKGMDKKVKD
ncbi:MAG: hypothetical protein QM737_09285 [Ferruginibacter sp.]